jgi:excisionase family DNA binding protein
VAAKNSTGQSAKIGATTGRAKVGKSTGQATGKSTSKGTEQPSAKAGTGKMPKTTSGKSLKNTSVGKDLKVTAKPTSKHKTGPVRIDQVRIEQVPGDKSPVGKLRMQKVPVTGRLVTIGTIDRDRVRDLEEVITGATEITISAGTGKTTVLSGVLLTVIRDVAAALEYGESVTVLGENTGTDLAGAVISSQEAADLLNVSRPHVVKLARSGQLPHHMVGNRHRFNLADVLAHAEQMRTVRTEALAAIVPEGGYTAEDF